MNTSTISAPEQLNSICDISYTMQLLGVLSDNEAHVFRSSAIGEFLNNQGNLGYYG
jgi:hypothetical protein